MLNREFLQLGQVFDPTKHFIGGWFMSEKLDGMRAFWDGGITRGLATCEVPFANTAKDHIRVEQPIATGLWSRYGHVIYAPDFWLNQLPTYPLDGELYLGRGRFQELVSIVKRFSEKRSEDDWYKVQYKVFDAPGHQSIFQDGRIYNPQWKTTFTGVYDWVSNRIPRPVHSRTFEANFSFLSANLRCPVAFPLEHIRLPFQTEKALDTLYEKLAEVTGAGGEGLILRDPNAVWTPKRMKSVLKVKKLQDDEATVIGYTAGKGKHLKRMGALITEYKGQRFELSGFTDEERILVGHYEEEHDKCYDWLTNNEGKDVPSWITSTRFPRGSQVTFTYRELTKDGLPREARYLRKRYD